jgi:hypothetical protein
VRVAILLLLLTGVASAKEDHGVPLPSGTRQIADGRYVSPAGFRDTVDYLVKSLGVESKDVKVEKYKEVTYVRIVSKERRSEWQAVHVMLAEGKTFIYIVAPQK